MARRLRDLAAGLAAVLGSCSGAWFDGLPNVKVFSPERVEDLQLEAAALFARQYTNQFATERYALLLLPGDYGDTVIKVGFYTQVAGVGWSPHHVRLKGVSSVNGPDGLSLVNFWRSAEGLTLSGDTTTWAVSQAAPLRRLVVDGDLHLSDGAGWASGGFLADVEVKGTLNMGVQQQWIARNAKLGKGLHCPVGWNYVFVGVAGLSHKDALQCRGSTPGKVSIVARTPRVAEKPYVVLDEDGDWKILVPEYRSHTAGTVVEHQNQVARKFVLVEEVFIAQPGLTAAQINAGIADKSGVLFTPGVYKLEEPVRVQRSGFVVLGLGFATLVSVSGRPVLEVADALLDVRIAGLLLEAGSTDMSAETEPLLRWGSQGAAARRASAGHRAVPGGVLSDVFARVGAFRYGNCKPVRADVMVEINTHGVVIDNMWLWHADHDDCKLAENKYGHPGMHAHQFLDEFASNACYSRHGLRVLGSHVTAYGLAVEHVVDGHLVWREGAHGQTYFFQAELPYHRTAFGDRGYAGYAVAPAVTSHRAEALSVYLIGPWVHARAAVLAPPSAVIEKVVSVVIHGERAQFAHSACWPDEKDSHCYAPESCWGGGQLSRCFLAEMPRQTAHHPAELVA